MFVATPRFTAPLSPLPQPQAPRQVLCRLSLLLSFALGLSGCQARPVVSVLPFTPARSLTGPSAAVVQVQSSSLYQQARQDCKRHDYRHAAELLKTLAAAPGLAPDAVAFCNAQRYLCLKDAGLPVASSPVVASLPVRAPLDADCGPRALLLVCQKLGVKTSLETLRKTAGTTAQGTTLAGLQQAAQKLGLQAEGVQVSRDALSNTALPAIAWMNRDHYAALLSLSGSGDRATATIRDPNRSAEETLSQEQLLQRSGGYLLLVHR